MTFTIQNVLQLFTFNFFYSVFELVSRNGWWCFETNSSSGYCTVSTQSSAVATDFDNNYKTSRYVDKIEKLSTLTNSKLDSFYKKI